MNLVGDLSVEMVATLPADDVLGIAIAGLDERSLVVATAETRGFDFCPACLDPDSTDCAATCRRAVIDVTMLDTVGTAFPPDRVIEVFPRSPAHDVTAIDIVALDDTHAGVAWLDCDHSTCGPGTEKQSCTAGYRTIDLLTGNTGPVSVLYQGWYGDLQLAFDRRARRLLALLGSKAATGVGVYASIYNELGTAQHMPWTPQGGAFARAPVATASSTGFVIVAEDPAPTQAAPPEPCAEACDCQGASAPDLAAGGLYVFRPGGVYRTERISPGRGGDGAYRPREVIAAIDVGGRVVVASSQSTNKSAELFEPEDGDDGGWQRRHVSKAPMPTWLGALGDYDHLAWIGSEDVPAKPTRQQLVAGVVLKDPPVEQRGDLLEIDLGEVLQAAPVTISNAVTTTYLLRGVSTPGAGPRWTRFEVLEVSAAW